MTKEYLLGLGYDSEKLFKGFKDTIGLLEQVENKSQDVGKSIDEAFTEGAKASEELDKSVKKTSKNLEVVRDLGKAAGKELAEALSGKNVNTSEFSKKMDDFKKKISDITGKVDIKISDEKLIIFQRQIQAAESDFEQLNVAMNIGKEIMSSLDPNSSEFKQLGEALSFCENAFNELNQQVKENESLLNDTSRAADGASNDVERLNDTLDKNDSQNQRVTVSNRALSATFEQVYGELQPLSTRLSETEDRLYELYFAGQQNTQEFRELQTQAIAFRRTIQEVDAAVDNFARSSAKIDALVEGATGLVGAFAAVQGVVGLVAGENEELEEALLKVNSAMAILQGLQAVAQVLNRDSAFSVMFLRGATVANTAATVADSAASVAHTALVAVQTTAEAALAAAVIAETEAEFAAIAATQAHAIANTEATATAETAALATLAQAQANRQLAAAEVQTATGAVANSTAQAASTVAMGGATIAANVLGFALKAIGIGLIILAVAALVEYWDELKDGMKELLPAGADVGKMFDNIKSYAFGVGNAILQFVIAPIKALNQLLKTGDVSGAIDTYMKGIDVMSNFKNGKDTQDARNADKRRNEEEKKDIEFQKRQLERRRNRGEDTYKEEQKLYQREIALKKKTREDTAEVEKSMEDAQDKRTAENNKKAEDARKRAAEKAKKDREEAAKKAQEEAKRNNDLSIKYADELSKMLILNQEESLKQKMDIIQNEADLRIKAIEREGATSATAKAKAEALINEIQKKAEADKSKIIQESLKEKYSLQSEADKTIIDLKKDSLDKEIDLLRYNTQEQLDAITEKYSKDEATQTRLIEAVQENMNRKEKELKIKYGEEQLKLDEEKAVLGVELASTYAKKTEETERQKQIALLRVRLEYAIKNLDQIVEDGTEETELRKLNAQKAVSDAQEAVSEAIKNNNNRDFDFLDFLGIGEGMKAEDRQKLRGAINESMEVMKEFTSFMIDNYQEQMDKKAEQVEQTQSEIDDLESKLEDEKSLRDQGLANNVEVIEAEIAEKERQKNEQIRQEEELLEKKKAMQKVQLALDTVSQLSGLITASTNIFQGFSTIPIVGIPLAIAMIGLMFGTFVASKAKAAQAINQQTVQHAEGGEISGRSHSQGGEKYFNKDGSKVKELEDGEFVVKKRQYRKFDKLVRAINDNDFSGLTVNDYAVAEMFRGMGFDFDTGVADVKNLQITLMTMGYSANESQHLADISKGIALLVESERNTPKSWSDGTYNFLKIGIKTTKTRLTPLKIDDEDSE